jgi:hypothetical protein
MGNQCVCAGDIQNCFGGGGFDAGFPDFDGGFGGFDAGGFDFDGGFGGFDAGFPDFDGGFGFP